MRDLVFVSYSHDDAAWAQAFAEILKPLVRGRRLRVWVDTTNIRAGDRWHPEIERGIAGSDLALLLVSRSYLASDFIMETELPALIAARVRLAPVLVGDCMWRHVVELADVQWLHDPGRDGALSLFAGNPGERDRRLVRICEVLLPMLSAAPASPPVAVAPTTVRAAAVPEGPTAGALSGVPALPHAYLVRPELAGLVAAVVADDDALGLVGPAVGVHGQGGIGKSVLAAALARDDGVRRRFPDGIYWVTVGEHADVLAIQIDLLTRLGAGPSTARTAAEATAELRSALARMRVLLVVDDVWTAADAQAFRVTGPQGRVVYTTRDAALVVAVGAAARAVDVLSPASARELAAEVLGGIAPPAEADGAFAAVGHTPLGVALVSAAVAGGRGWAELAAELARDVYGDHPSANAFKAMQAAVGALPADLAKALMSLAVFPADAVVPIAAFARLWAHTRGIDPAQTAADLDRLAAAGVLQRIGDAISFHDLQHDYLVLHAPPLAGLHAELVAAYRALVPAEPSPWWRLPDDEPYILDHLVTHLGRAGDRAAVIAAVTDPAYLARRMATAGGVHGAEADLAAATALLPDEQPVGWLRGWLGRHAHLLAVNENAASLVPTTLRAWLSADPDTARHGVDPSRLRPLLTRPRLDVLWGLVPRPAPLVRVLQADVNLVSAAWSPDGALLATGGDDEVLLWDTVDWTQVDRLAGHDSSVHLLAWASTGALASADGRGRVRCWDPASRAVTSLPVPFAGVAALTWARDGARLFAVRAEPGVARVHDAASGALIWSGGGGDHDMVTAWSLGDATLAVAGVGEVAVVSLESGARLAAVSTTDAVVFNLAWSADGARLAMSTAADILVWEPAGGDAPTRVLGAPFSLMSWSPDGSRLALFGYDESTVRVVNPVDGTQRAALTGHGRAPTAMAWWSDRLAVVTGDRVHVWDVTAAERVGPPVDGDRARHMAWSADGSAVAVLDTDTGGVVALHDPRTGRRRAAVSVRYPVAIALSPDGRRLATGHTDGGVEIHRITASEEVQPSRVQLGHVVSALSWSPDGTRVAAGWWDGFVRLWDVAEEQPYVTFERQDGWITGLAWSPEGDRLAVTARAGPAVTFWATDTGRRLGELPTEHDAIGPFAWSPDGSRMATGRGDAAVLVWDAASGAVVATLTGHSGEVTGIAWSGDGDRLATADDQGLLVVRSLSEPVHTTRIRLEPVTEVAWTSAGLAAASTTGVVVFDVG